MEDAFRDIGSMSERLRTKREDGHALISGDDVQKLTDILLAKVPDTDEAR
jgi:hypothetical protein